ncbi:MAG TPA: PEGA domain-containing protein [Kofleriaceae bacterium]
MVRRLLSLVVSAAIVVAPLSVSAQPAGTPDVSEPEAALDAKIAVWRFDALGIDADIAARLETLFRNELSRLAKTAMPSRRDIERQVTGDLLQCTGEEKCLAAIGKKLGVDVVVTGTVGSLGSNYVLDIKAVDVATAKTIKRTQSEPLQGSPDELIDNVRVAAYRLLAPQQLHGSVQVQTDLVGAEVRLDGDLVGKTPLPNQGVISKLGLGPHKLHVQAPGYDPFDDNVTVNFQKVAQVEVRLLVAKEMVGTGRVQKIERRPFYTRTWFIVGAVVVGVAAAALIGHSTGKVKCTLYQDGVDKGQVDC